MSFIKYSSAFKKSRITSTASSCRSTPRSSAMFRKKTSIHCRTVSSVVIFIVVIFIGFSVFLF